MRFIAYISLAWFLMAFLPNCTLDRVSGSTNSIITEADLEAATLILGESISGNNSGVYLSVQDALAIISQSGFSPKEISSKKAKVNYDQISNFRTRYNQETGIHIVTFERSTENRLKNESDSLQYIYRDQNGDFVAFPREQQNLIESISFSGNKIGNIRTTTTTSSFERQNDFFIPSTSNENNTITLNGIHLGSGFTTVEDPDGQSLQRYYELTFNFLNIEIEQFLNDQNQITDFNFIGGLKWVLQTWNSPEKTTDPITLDGTMSFIGDGTVLVRFNEIEGIIKLDVQTGQVISDNQTQEN